MISKYYSDHDAICISIRKVDLKCDLINGAGKKIKKIKKIYTKQNKKTKNVGQEERACLSHAHF